MRDSVKTEEVVVKLAELTPNPKNPRQIKEKNFKNLKKSVKQDKWMLGLDRIIVDENNVILSGHQRVKALMANGETEIKVCRALDLTPDEKERVLIRANVADGEWDMDTLANMFDADFLTDLGLDIPVFEDKYADGEAGALTKRYGYPPFSVLDTKQGAWQEQVDKWLELGIKSELGRDENVLGAGLQKLAENSNANASKNYGVSVFDPFLCELMYKWFCPVGGSIIDPFAGGSVRGIVANELGYKYNGIDLREEQIKANIANAKDICKGTQPNWLVGDSNEVLDTLKDGSYDFVFSCPPYADLEVYSDDPRDISNMEYVDFMRVYRSIIAKAVAKLKPNRFAVFVVSEVRAKNGGGKYRSFVPDTIKAFEDAGAGYYNEIILLNKVGTARLRAGKQFNASRKVCRLHQNVLVFYKGDIKQIKNIYNELEFDYDDEDELELEL